MVPPSSALRAPSPAREKREGALDGVGVPAINRDRHIFLPGCINKSVCPNYSHTNHLGSPVASTNASGTLLWREDYTPFGEARQQPAANDNDEGYTGHITDSDTGIVYMQARYYDPAIGRFLSEDPVGFGDEGWRYFNRYTYVSNDPLNTTDPTGMFQEVREDHHGRPDRRPAIFVSFQRVLAGGDESTPELVYSETVSWGWDFEDMTSFRAVSYGEPAPGVEGSFGLQGGAGLMLGIAESAEFLEAPAMTTDFDLVDFSITFSQNEVTPGGDDRVRQFSIGIGSGGGASQLLTQGDGDLEKRPWQLGPNYMDYSDQ